MSDPTMTADEARRLRDEATPGPYCWQRNLLCAPAGTVVLRAFPDWNTDDGDGRLLESAARALDSVIALHAERDAALALLAERDAEIERQAAEIASLRASRGTPTGAEPIGCPLPGCCSAVALTENHKALRAFALAVADGCEGGLFAFSAMREIGGWLGLPPRAAWIETARAIRTLCGVADV